MTKRLIVSAHPSSAGFTHRIVSTCVEVSKQTNHEVDLIDLYDPLFTQDFVRMDETKKPILNEKTPSMQQKILWADEIILVFPLWWGSFPAILKNWIDNNFGAGFAFKFDEKGKAHGLLGPRRIRIYLTSDAPAFVYKFPLNLITTNIKASMKFLFGFCGLKISCFEIIGAMHKQDETARLQILERIKKSL